MALLAVILSGCSYGADREESTVPTRETQQVTESSPQSFEETKEVPVSEDSATNYANVKAIWLSQYDLWDVYLHNGSQRPREDFILRMEEILTNIRDLGFNTVFLQVRPNGDSMCPSRYCPMSKYVVGTYGGELEYDPVLLIVKLAKELDLSIHAWINPMRGMKTAELEAVSPAYAIRQWYDDPQRNGTWLVQWGDYWYLNPAYQEVRQLIVDGAAELLNQYAFDGLHMDDYFYPTKEPDFDQRPNSE